MARARRSLGRMETGRDNSVAVSSPSVTVDQRKRPWRYGKWGSVVGSADFLSAVPTGVGLGAVAAYSSAVANSAPAILIAFLGVLVALGGVVIAAHTLIVTLISPEYLEVLTRATGGIKAVSKPYLIVIWVCVVGAVSAGAAALVWPLCSGSSLWLPRTCRWMLIGVPALLTTWALIGSAQLVGLNAFHLEQRASLLLVLRDLRQRGTGTRSA